MRFWFQAFGISLALRSSFEGFGFRVSVRGSRAAGLGFMSLCFRVSGLGFGPRFGEFMAL